MPGVTLPSSSTTFATEGADQVILTHRLPDRPVGISWNGPDGGVVTSADSHGRASVNLSSAESPGFVVPQGSIVEIVCQAHAGDVVDRTVTAP